MWRSIDDSLAVSVLTSRPGCQFDVRAAGSTLDANHASHAEITAALTGVVASPELIADRLLDWVDADDVARPLGAERSDYEHAGLAGPKNQPIVDVAEFGQILGIPAEAVAAVIGVDSSRISLSSAPGPVLAALPGFSGEAIEALLRARSAGQDVRDLRVFADGLSRYSGDQLIAAYPEIVRRISLTPEWWCLGARVSTGIPARLVRVAVRVARRGSSVAVVGSC
jgi:type II secretory pathway component PulK